MRNLLDKAAMIMASIGLTASAHAAIQINEVFTNPPGTDDTQEFFEMRGTTGGVEAMTGLTLLIIEGEGVAAGTVDVAMSLDSFATGTNGLFYWRANAAVGAFTPSPSPLSTVNTADFAPDLENGSQTYLLVSGFTGTVATDLDTNDDGVFDSTPWGSVVDAVGVKDTTVADILYAAAFGGPNFPTAPAGFEAETIFRLTTGEWVASDIAGTNPGGPYTYDPIETIFADGSTAPVGSFDFDDVSPGSINPTVVPEPGAVGVLAMAVRGMGRRRRLAKR